MFVVLDLFIMVYYRFFFSHKDLENKKKNLYKTLYRDVPNTKIQ